MSEVPHKVLKFIYIHGMSRQRAEENQDPDVAFLKKECYTQSQEGMFRLTIKGLQYLKTFDPEVLREMDNFALEVYDRVSKRGYLDTKSLMCQRTPGGLVQVWIQNEEGGACFLMNCNKLLVPYWSDKRLWYQKYLKEVRESK